MIIISCDRRIEFGMDICFRILFENPIRDTSSNQYVGQLRRHFQNDGRRLAIYWYFVYFPYLLVDCDVKYLLNYVFGDDQQFATIIFYLSRHLGGFFLSWPPKMKIFQCILFQVPY